MPSGESSSRDVLTALDSRVPDRLVAAALRGASGASVRASATVVLLADSADGLQVYVLHRHSGMAFAAGMVVFPGGQVDPADHREVDDHLPELPADDHGLGDLGQSDLGQSDLGPSDHGRDDHRGSGRPAGVDHGIVDHDVDAHDLDDHERSQLVLRRCAVRETAEETGVRLEQSALRPWAHWITPAAEPRRYDTWFYLAAMPADQQARDISGEASHAEWRRPIDLLRAADAGELALLPPTRSVLIELSAFATVAEALAAASRRRIETVLPRPVQRDGGWVFVYDTAESEPAGPDRGDRRNEVH